MVQDVMNSLGTSQIIRQVSPPENLTRGGVKVIAGFSGVQRGTLSECGVSIWNENEYLRVREITLSQRLGKSLRSCLFLSYS